MKAKRYFGKTENKRNETKQELKKEYCHSSWTFVPSQSPEWLWTSGGPGRSLVSKVKEIHYLDITIHFTSIITK